MGNTHGLDLRLLWLRLSFRPPLATLLRTLRLTVEFDNGALPMSK